MPRTRIRGTTPASVRSTGGSGSGVPVGAALIQDSLGALEISGYGETNAAPTDVGFADISVATAETNAAPVEGYSGAAMTPDSTANERTAVLIGSVEPVLVPSPHGAAFGNALYFDGVNRGANTMGMSAGTAAALAPTAAWCFEAKVTTPPALPSGSAWIIGGRWSGAVGGRQFVVGIASSAQWTVASAPQGAASGSVGTQIFSASSPQPNTTYDVAATYDGTTLRLFVNGTLVASGALASVETPDSTTRFIIGRSDDTTQASTGAYPWQGTIDAVRMSNIARYTANYVPSTSPFVVDANTVGLWRMDALIEPVGTSGGLEITGLNETNATPSETQSMKVVYAATGTFVPPAGVTSVTVECWGGGAGGGNGSTTAGGAGGVGGSYARSVIPVTPGNSYTVTVGAGGTGAGPGGNSWFGSTTTVLARGGGQVTASVGTTTFTGGAQTAGAGLGAGAGGAGGAGDSANGGVAAGATGGAGGVNDGGNGGNGGASGAAGSPGAVRGGGGGGGGFSVTSPGAGAAGGRGEVRIGWRL